MESQMKTLKLR